ncbi:MAG: hypothetical protein BWY76_01445 [bacterium ADurb.Bin429]|nr:MAG: hypothetical protein BWY76_01445 [bacterium ADurb.Bin429]
MRVFLLLLLGCIAGWLTGCASGNSLTGGSVPIGTIDGWVYRSVPLEASTRQAAEVEAVSGITVELVPGSGQVMRTTTDNTGYFIFRNVPKGPVRIRAGQQAALYAEVQAEVERNGDRVGVALMLAPEIADAVASLLITPAAVGNMHPGDEIVFTAQVLTNSGQQVAVPASWALKGEIGSFAPRLSAGSVTPGGLFRATTPGTGRVIAQYKGLVAMAPITVLPAGVNP